MADAATLRTFGFQVPGDPTWNHCLRSRDDVDLLPGTEHSVHVSAFQRLTSKQLRVGQHEEKDASIANCDGPAVAGAV